ncbi:uncharacterized protein [Diadema antillarum]|uniref:uncharacterized protein n=1 Tax=Diadema antillarum TaxID=105358 RepID=UPI003A83C154
MAAEGDFQDALVDFDSDDEFFDALASESQDQNKAESLTTSAQQGESSTESGGLPDCASQTASSVHKHSEETDNPSRNGGELAQSACTTSPSLEDSSHDSGLRDTPNDKEETHRNSLESSVSELLHPGDQIASNEEDYHEGLRAEENEDEAVDEVGQIEEKEEEVVEEVDSVDEEKLRQEREDAMTEEERVKLKDEAQSHKAEGNDLFKQLEFLDAMSKYTEALSICPLCYKKERAIMYANRAACQVRRELYEKAVEDCNKALELHPHYLKVWLRRANTYELMEKLDEALADFQKVLELDPSCYEARAACMRLPDQIKERNEKLKEEMFGKLKELGNMVLRPFGLSTNNFQLQQDPNTGSYSVNFQQNPGNGS